VTGTTLKTKNSKTQRDPEQPLILCESRHVLLHKSLKTCVGTRSRMESGSVKNRHFLKVTRVITGASSMQKYHKKRAKKIISSWIVENSFAFKMSYYRGYTVKPNYLFFRHFAFSCIFQLNRIFWQVVLHRSLQNFAHHVLFEWFHKI
jgi:hypothetical protein